MPLLRRHNPAAPSLPELPDSPPESAICIRGHVNTLTGYGLHVLHVTKELLARGYPVYVEPLQSIWEPWGQTLPAWYRARLVRSIDAAPWQLLVSPPPEAPLKPRTALWTMWESGRLPMGAAGAMSAATVVLVPCEWNLLTFDAQWVDAPLRRVPLGYDPEIFYPRPPRTELPVRFLCAGRYFSGGWRKGVEESCKAFLEAFPNGDEPVQMIVKIYEDCRFRIPPDPRLIVDTGALTESGCAELLASVDAYISMAKGEGFGMWCIQAMASGRPVIAAAAHAHADYLDASCGFPVNYAWEPARLAEGHEGVPYQGLWAVPDIEHAAALMRRAAAGRESALAFQGRRAALRARHFTWEKSVDRLLEVLAEAGLVNTFRERGRDTM